MPVSFFDRLVNAPVPGRDQSRRDEWDLRSQLERLLGTRRTAFVRRAEPGADPGAVAAAGPLGDDRLLTFGLEHPRRTVVTVDMDLATLEAVLRRCIKRHLPWVTRVDVRARKVDAGREGRIVVPIEVHICAPQETRLKLQLHRLAREVKVAGADDAGGGGGGGGG